MGFINIGGKTIHTSGISGSVGIKGSVIYGTPSVSSSLGLTSSSGITSTNSITTSTINGQYLTWGGSSMNYSTQKTIYHVLGENIEVFGYIHLI